MKRVIDKWTTSASIALVLGALVACKKKTEAPAPEASAAPVSLVASALASASAAAQAAASAVPVAVAPPAVDAGVAAPVVGDVKRFPDKEKLASGAVKVTVDESKVYDEPDDTKPSVASLSKGLFVVRQATLGTDWILVEFPSGVGKLSPGWIEAKSLGEQVQPAVTKAAVAAQTAATVASAKPATSASASAKAATTAALVPTTSAAAGVPTAPPTPTPVPTVKKKPSLLSPPHH